jgi:ABC-type glycerol-3-phosphate transport system permease component
MLALAGLIAAVPVVVVFILAQRAIVRGPVARAVAGQ